MDKATPQMRLAAVIRAQRQKLGYSQEGFADKLGMHRAYYGTIELGKRNITLETSIRVATGLGTDLATLARKAKI
jgi:transcriptional regulator with XRE-family HTH domain